MNENSGEICDDLRNLFALQTPDVCGMQNLNREAFRKVVKLSALQIEAKHCTVFRKKLQKLLLNQPRMKNIMADPDPNNRTKKVLLLHPGKCLSEEDREFAESHGAMEIIYELVLGYEHWTSEQVLRAILPQDISDVPSGFETVGHIAHVNLRDNQLQFKNIIGQVILDKNSPQIKTVVNKTNTIDDTFRFFKMEVIAGKDNLQTSITQDGITYELDFSKVYWNSRLQTEHKRLVDSFSPGSVICDMFAGVGPFAIPAAKKGCFVYANDLNPNSYSALVRNAKLNHVTNNIKAYNIDGREFLQKVVKDVFQGNSSSKMFEHVVMNLPASAVQFLDVFKGLFADYENRFSSEKPKLSLPTIHCYCFSKAEDPAKDAQRQAEEVLGVKLTDICEVHNVRNVAPKKQMMCVSFKLPEAVAFGSGVVEGCGATKRQREYAEDGPFPKHTKVDELPSLCNSSQPKTE